MRHTGLRLSGDPDAALEKYQARVLSKCETPGLAIHISPPRDCIPCPFHTCKGKLQDSPRYVHDTPLEPQSYYYYASLFHHHYRFYTPVPIATPNHSPLTRSCKRIPPPRDPARVPSIVGPALPCWDANNVYSYSGSLLGPVRLV
eukprot:scaffold1353_cov161-Amphora_coffeaeformis.AAC.7